MAVTTVQLHLRQFSGAYAIARLDAAAPLPLWADGPGFVSIGRTDDELSIACLAERVPADVRRDDGWVCFKVQGPFDFAETGIALAIIRPLAEAGIGIFLVSTFDTDYLLVKAANLEQARSALLAAGHRLDKPTLRA